MRTPHLVFVLVTAGCKMVPAEVPVAAPDVRAAANEIQGGAPEARVTDQHGYVHSVVAGSEFTGFGAASPSTQGSVHLGNRFTLVEIGRACGGQLMSPATTAACPTDEPALAARGSAFRGPWLQTRELVPDGKTIGGLVLGGLLLGALAAFVGGQVVCFNSPGCSDGDGGRAAFLTGDVVLGVGVYVTTLSLLAAAGRL